MKDLNEDKVSAVGEDLFDGVFEKEVDAKGQPRGTKSVQKTAVKLVLNFDGLRALKGIQLADLDSWFEQFAIFVIDVQTITDACVVQPTRGLIGPSQYIALLQNALLVPMTNAFYFCRIVVEKLIPFISLVQFCNPFTLCAGRDSASWIVLLLWRDHNCFVHCIFVIYHYF